MSDYSRATISTPPPLDPTVVSSIKQVLSQLKKAGETPLPWREFSSRYKTLSRTELVPSFHGYNNVLAMLEYLAECGQCVLSKVQGGVCVDMDRKRREMDEVDLSMLDLPWAQTGELPVGAVDGESLEQQQVVGVRVGAHIPVQVTEVVSFDTVWFCLQPVEEREKLMEEMDIFYNKGEGRRWEVPDGEYCWAGRLMAAKYKYEGFHRVMVKRMLEGNMVSVLYVDFGTVDKVKLKDVRLLHKKFLKLPAQAIEGRLWGVKEIEGMEAQAKKKLVELVSEGNIVPHGMVGKVMAGVRVRPGDRRRDGVVETTARLALWLIDLAGDSEEGDWVNDQLVREGMADWDMLDIRRFRRRSNVVKHKKTKAVKVLADQKDDVAAQLLQTLLSGQLLVEQLLDSCQEAGQLPTASGRGVGGDDEDHDGAVGGEKPVVKHDVEQQVKVDAAVPEVIRKTKIIDVDDSSG